MTRLAILAAVFLFPTIAMGATPRWNASDYSGSVSMAPVLHLMQCPCETITIAAPKGNRIGGWRSGTALTVTVPVGSKIVVHKESSR